MISQCSLCITHSPIHTVEYYTKMALELIELGADEICIKDMAGIGRPYSLGQIVANIKAKHPEIPIQYHSHAGPGFNVASILEVCNAGCDYIDVGMEPLSWGCLLYTSCWRSLFRIRLLHLTSNIFVLNGFVI